MTTLAPGGAPPPPPPGGGGLGKKTPQSKVSSSDAKQDDRVKCNQCDSKKSPDQFSLKADGQRYKMCNTCRSKLAVKQDDDDDTKRYCPRCYTTKDLEEFRLIAKGNRAKTCIPCLDKRKGTKKRKKPAKDEAREASEVQDDEAAEGRGESEGEEREDEDAEVPIKRQRKNYAQLESSALDREAVECPSSTSFPPDKADEAGKRKCSRCSVQKDLSLFPPNHLSGGEPSKQCKPCIEKKRDYRQKKNEEAKDETDKYDHASLMQLAADSQQRIMADVRRRTQAGEQIADPDFTRPSEYNSLGIRELKRLAQERSIAHATRVTIETLRRMLQRYDAERGIDPRFAFADASQYASMRLEEPRELARRMGMPGAIVARKARLFAYLHEENFQRSATSSRTVTAEEAWDIFPGLVQGLLNDPSVRDALNQVEFRVSQNQRLGAENPHYDRLADVVARNVFPTETSNRGLMCGLRSLLGALHTMINLDRQPNERPRDRLELSPVLRLLYRNFDSADGPHRSLWAADLNELPHFATPNMPGDPTTAYAAFLRRRLTAMGWQQGTDVWNEEWRQLTTMNNFNITQLQFILDFITEQGLVDREFALGVVTGGNATQRAQAQIVGRINLNVTVLWIYNNNVAEEVDGDLLNHCSAFEENGSDWALALLWGLQFDVGVNLRPEDIPTLTISNPTSALLSAEEQATVKARRDRYVEAQRPRYPARREADKARKKCFPCREDDVDCDGQPGRPRTNCTNGHATCDWPGHMNDRAIRWYKGGDYNDQIAARHDRSLENWEEVLECAEGCILTPKPGEPFAMLFICLRVSSDPQDPDYMQYLVGQVPQIFQRYRNLLDGGNVLLPPEGAHPVAPYTPWQVQGVIFARQGTRPAPTAATNGLTDPYLAAWVQQIEHITDPNTFNRPLAIQILTMGVPGFTVDIHGIGTRQQGFFKVMLDADVNNQTDLVDTIDLVTVVEPRVVDGLLDCSLNGVGPPVPYFQGHAGKYVLTNKLGELIDREALVTNTAALNHARFLQGLQRNLNPPNTPWDQRLGLHLRALRDEWMWRSNNANAAVPTTAMQIASRNHRRNRPWQP